MRKAIFRREIDHIFSQHGLDDSVAKTVDEILNTLFENPYLPSPQYLLKKCFSEIGTVIDAVGGISVPNFDDNKRNAFHSDIRSLLLIDNDLELPQRLRDQLKQRKLAIFVGSGVSKLIGFPLWGELAQKAIAYLHDKKFISHAEKEKILNEPSSPKHKISIFHNMLSKEESMPFYQGVFELQQEPKNNPYDILAKIDGVKISINYDREFWNALNRMVISKAAPTSPEDLKIEKPYHVYNAVNKGTQLTSNAVYQIHGSYDHISEYSLITLRDYLDIYYLDKSDNLGSFLKEVFNSHVTLFVGCGMEEFEIIQHLVKGGEGHHMLIGTYINDTNLFRMKREYFKNVLGIDVHGYYVDYRGYDRLYDVLHSWERQIREAQQGRFYTDEVDGVEL